jgi:hypothetical protein
VDLDVGDRAVECVRGDDEGGIVESHWCCLS